VGLSNLCSRTVTTKGAPSGPGDLTPSLKGQSSMSCVSGLRREEGLEQTASHQPSICDMSLELTAESLTDSGQKAKVPLPHF